MSEPVKDKAPRLESHHRQMFENLRVHESLLASGQIRSVSHWESTQLVGDFHKFDLTGLAFPYRRSGEARPQSHRIRRDNVRGDEPKYIAPPGHRALYFLPANEGLLGDVTAHAIFVESEKATLTLTALAERAQRRWLVVGLGGCFGWRCKIGSDTAPDGSRFDVTGPHPDLNLIAVQSRDVIICLDTNVSTNRRVAKAEREFADVLQAKGAKVRLARIPASPGLNGPDDYLVAFGDEATLRIMDSAAVPPRSGINPWDAARDITSFLNERDIEVEVLEPRVLEREAVTQVFSPRGIGKSEWATELAIRQAKAGRRVLYLDRDNSPRKTRERFRAWGAEGVLGLKVLTRDKIPPLTRADSWALFPCSDYDFLVVDSLDSHAEGVGEKDSAKPSRAIAPLLDIAHRDGGLAILVLGNCVRSGAHSRGSGVVEDRGDFVYEVRDITGWTPKGGQSWWEELPPADAGSWASRASRRKQRQKIRLAFVCTKFRGMDEPDPFAFEIDFSTDPRSFREVTDEIDAEGAAARAQRARDRAETIEKAIAALVMEIARRNAANEPAFLKKQAEAFLTHLPGPKITQKKAREVTESETFELVPIPGKGHSMAVQLASKKEERDRNNDVAVGTTTLGENGADFGGPQSMHSTETDPSQTSENRGSEKTANSVERSLLSPPATPQDGSGDDALEV